MNGTITIIHEHAHGHESIETEADGFYQGTRFDVFRSRNEVWIANGKEHCDRGIVKGTWHAHIASRYEGDTGYTIPFHARNDELLPGTCEVVFVGGIKYRPNVPAAFLDWWGVDRVPLDGVSDEDLAAINRLGPAGDDLGDAGTGGGARLVPRVAQMAAAIWHLTPLGVTFDQLDECERWIRNEGRRTCHWYTATGEPFHVEEMGSRDVVRYRAPSHNPWTGKPAVPADHEATNGGRWCNAPDYAHVSTQLAEVAALTGSPSALRFQADIMDCVFSSMSPGVRMARAYGWLWLGCAKVAGVARPYFPDVAQRMDRYVAASLPHAEAAHKHVPAGADPAVDPAVTLPVAAPPRDDHIGVTDAMREWRDELAPTLTDDDLADFCKSCADWQAGIYLTGLLAALVLCDVHDNGTLGAAGRSPVAVGVRAYNAAEAFLRRCRQPALDHETMAYRTGQNAGWHSDIGGGTIPGTDQGVTLARTHNDGKEGGTLRRFTVPACEASGYPDLLEGSDDVAAYCIEHGAWGGGSMLETYLGPWIERAVRTGIGQ